MIQRNLMIDIIKFIATVGVVLIHISSATGDILFHSTLLKFAHYGFRFAVPFFILCSGYYIVDYKSTIEKFVYLYVLYNIVFLIPNYIAINMAVYIKYIGWYFIAMLWILVLLSPQKKKLTSVLFVVSILYNIMFGNFLESSLMLFSFKRNNALTYLWIFILGTYLKNINWKKFSKKLGVISILIGVFGMLFNGFVLLQDQYMLYSSCIAISLMIGALIVDKTTHYNIERFLLSIFLYHGLFIPFTTKIDTTKIMGLGLSLVLVIALSLLVGVVIKKLELLLKKELLT